MRVVTPNRSSAKNYEPPVNLPCKRNCLHCGHETCPKGKDYGPENGTVLKTCKGYYQPVMVIAVQPKSAVSVPEFGGNSRR